MKYLACLHILYSTTVANDFIICFVISKRIENMPSPAHFFCRKNVDSMSNVHQHSKKHLLHPQTPPTTSTNTSHHPQTHPSLTNTSYTHKHILHPQRPPTVPVHSQTPPITPFNKGNTYNRRVAVLWLAGTCPACSPPHTRSCRPSPW